MAPSLDDIVTSGACIGCGLCAGVSGGAVRMAFTPEGHERPVGATAEPVAADVAAACPGLAVAGLSVADAGARATPDLMWGYWRRAAYAWAADPETRFRASTGGVMSAIAAHQIASGAVDYVLHVGPDPDRPARSRARISRTAEEAADTGGSRYGPAAPLAVLDEVRRLIEGGARFAFAGKPCDVSAIRLLARRQSWLADALMLTVALVCGGASYFSKTAGLLAAWEIDEADLTEFRYRGRGNPGPTSATTRDGRVRSTTYQALWEDESRWAIQHRCKICPDAIGMAADIVAADCWPGGGPVGEDEGFNLVITRTARGDAALDRAVADGALVLGDALGPADFERFQPHQSRKRRAVWARLLGQRMAAGFAPVARDTGIAEIARAQDWRDNLAQARGTRSRAQGGIEQRPRAAEATAERT